MNEGSSSALKPTIKKKRGNYSFKETSKQKTPNLNIINRNKKNYKFQKIVPYSIGQFYSKNIILIPCFETFQAGKNNKVDLHVLI